MLGGDSGYLMGMPLKPTPPELTFLTSVEAADLLRVSRRTLERMRIEGTGPRYLKVGPGKRSRVSIGNPTLLHGSTGRVSRLRQSIQHRHLPRGGSAPAPPGYLVTVMRPECPSKNFLNPMNLL